MEQSGINGAKGACRGDGGWFLSPYSIRAYVDDPNES